MDLIVLESWVLVMEDENLKKNKLAGRTRKEVIQRAEEKLEKAWFWAGGMTQTKVMCLKGKSAFLC